MPADAVEVFSRDGVICVKMRLEREINAARAAVDLATDDPSELGYRVNDSRRPGFFFTDYNLW